MMRDGGKDGPEVLGFAEVARMIRTAVIVVALCAFLAAESSADEPPPGLNPRVTVLSITGGLILTFKTWPLQSDVAKVLVKKLKAAGFRLDEKFPTWRSWTLKPHEWPGPNITRVCSELMSDRRIGSTLERCEADIMIKPAA